MQAERLGCGRDRHELCVVLFTEDDRAQGKRHLSDHLLADHIKQRLEHLGIGIPRQPIPEGAAVDRLRARDIGSLERTVEFGQAVAQRLRRSNGVKPVPAGHSQMVVVEGLEADVAPVNQRAPEALCETGDSPRLQLIQEGIAVTGARQAVRQICFEGEACLRTGSALGAARMARTMSWARASAGFASWRTTLCFGQVLIDRQSQIARP